MEMPASINVEIAIDKDGRHKYQVREGKKVTGWVDCEWNDGKIEKEKLKVAINCVYNPIEGETIGGRGRKIVKDSLRNKCFELFGKGLTPKQIVEKFGYKAGTKEYSNVYVYWTQWKVRHDKKTN